MATKGTSDADLAREATRSAPKDAVESRKTHWTIDGSHSLAEFSAKHMMITTVKGQIAQLRGTLVIDEQDPNQSSVEVELDAASIDTREEKRDAHLRSPDFLDVERFPKITFKSKHVEGAHKQEGDRFRVVGDLTVRDVTREVTLDCTYEGEAKDPWGGVRRSFSARTQLDRRDFGLTWNVALETGGILVSNNVKLELEVQAVHQMA
jgi:polyisoprenoid-binding protein YceI